MFDSWSSSWFLHVWLALLFLSSENNTSNFHLLPLACLGPNNKLIMIPGFSKLELGGENTFLLHNPHPQTYEIPIWGKNSMKWNQNEKIVEREKGIKVLQFQYLDLHLWGVFHTSLCENLLCFPINSSFGHTLAKSFLWL